MKEMKESRNEFFFFNDTATTEIYTLSLHDALPISLELMRMRFSMLCIIVKTAHQVKLPSAADRRMLKAACVVKDSGMF